MLLHLFCLSHRIPNGIDGGEIGYRRNDAVYAIPIRRLKTKEKTPPARRKPERERF